MPTMANVTVKAANGTTDVVFTQKSPSSGDNTVAMWRADALSAISFGKPVYTMSSRAGTAGKDRRVVGKLAYPYTLTDSTTGKVLVDRVAYFKTDATVPQDIPDTAIAEFVALGTNLQVAALIVAAYKEGFAPA